MTKQRLRTWGEIARRFDVSVDTVQRWAQLRGLPVRKGPGGQSGQIIADADELDRWERDSFKRLPATRVAAHY